MPSKSEQDPLRDEAFVASVTQQLDDVIASEAVRGYLEAGIFTPASIGAMAAFLTIKEEGLPAHYYKSLNAVGRGAAKLVEFRRGNDSM